MKTDKYTDKQGEERYSKYILASNMMMLDSKEKGADNHQPLRRITPSGKILILHRETISLFKLGSYENCS